MAQNSLPPEVLAERRAALEKYDTVAEAARALDIPHSTLVHTRNILKAMDADPDTLQEKELAVSIPAFDDGELPVDEILRRAEDEFRRIQAHEKSKKWYDIQLKEDKPYGLLFFGDPHLGAHGNNIILFNQHVEIAKRPHIYSVNMGDTTNNWVGRLMRLYAEQETSAATERRLLEWFMRDAGVMWLCWILGNHDVWNNGAAVHHALNPGGIPILDWRAQFQITHPGGTSVRIDASHGRKGNSLWNNLHSTLRSAKLGEFADIFVTGHTHNYGIEHLELAERNQDTWLLQTRGYKFFDSYALHGNFAEHQLGSSIMAVIDPRPDAKARVMMCTQDLELASDFIQFARESDTA